MRTDSLGTAKMTSPSSPRLRHVLPSISGTNVLPAIGMPVATSGSSPPPLAGPKPKHIASAANRSITGAESQHTRVNRSGSDSVTVSSGSSLALLSSLRQLEEQHAQVNAQLVELSAKYNSLQQSHSALQLEYLAVRQSNEVLRTDLKRVRVELSTYIEDAQQARQSSLEGFRQLVSLEREASELRESEAATQAKLETLTEEVQVLRQARDLSLERLQEVCHRQGSAPEQSMSPTAVHSRGETAVAGVSSLTRPFSGSAGRRVRALSEAVETEAVSGPDGSPPGIQTPASKRLFNMRKGGECGISDGLWESDFVQVRAVDGKGEMATMPMKLHAISTTREKRREKYLLGRTTATLKPGLV